MMRKIKERISMRADALGATVPSDRLAANPSKISIADGYNKRVAAARGANKLIEAKRIANYRAMHQRQPGKKTEGLTAKFQAARGARISPVVAMGGKINPRAASPGTVATQRFNNGVPFMHAVSPFGF